MANLSQSSKDVFAESKGNNQEFKREFSEDEESLIARMFKLVGDRWHLIAGRISDRTAKEIEKYWTTRHPSQ